MYPQSHEIEGMEQEYKSRVLTPRLGRGGDGIHHGHFLTLCIAGLREQMKRKHKVPWTSGFFFYDFTINTESEYQR